MISMGYGLFLHLILKRPQAKRRSLLVLFTCYLSFLHRKSGDPAFERRSYPLYGEVSGKRQESVREVSNHEASYDACAKC